MSRTIEEIKEICPRFRILVMGRRNAGKTTILKKMCGSDGSDLVITDAAGNKVNGSTSFISFTNYLIQVDPSIVEPNLEVLLSGV